MLKQDPRLTLKLVLAYLVLQVSILQDLAVVRLLYPRVQSVLLATQGLLQAQAP